MPVSETKKHGVLASGCRFSNKEEHVPIKKRRFFLRSPSPPPVYNSPCSEEIADQTKSQDVSIKPQSPTSDISSSQVVENKNCIDPQKTDNSNKSFGEDEDFYGISILAAAACSSSLGRDCGYAEDGSGIEESSVQERVPEVSTYAEAPSLSKGLLKEDVMNSSEISSGATSLCISTEPVVELASISTTVNSSQNVVAVGKMKDVSLGFSSDVSCSKNEYEGWDHRQSSRDVKLHWDLNVVMDAWEQPFDDPGVQNVVAHDISQDAGKVDHNENMELKAHDSRENLVTLHAAKSCLLPGEQKSPANQSSVHIKDTYDTDSCLSLKQPQSLGEKPLSTNSNLNLNVVNCMAEDSKSMHCDENVDLTVGVVAAPPDQTAQLSASYTVNEVDDASVKILDLNDNSVSYRPVIEGLKTDGVVASCQLQNFGNACASDAAFGAVSADSYISLCVSSSSKVNQNITVLEDLETHKNFHHEEKSLIENADLKEVKHLEHAEVAVSDENAPLHTEASNSVPKRCELPLALDTKLKDFNHLQDGNIVSNNETIKNPSENCSVILMDSCDFSNHETCKINLDNCSNYSDNTDYEGSLKHSNDVGVQCYPVLVVGTDAIGELQEGYDSQYEDGELRESSEHAWEEYDAGDRAAENIDFISNYRETHMANSSEDHVSESGQDEDRKSERLGTAAAVTFHDCKNDKEVFEVASKAVGNDRERDEGNQIKSSHAGEKTEIIQQKELLESSKSFSDIGNQGIDDIRRKNRMPSHIDGLDRQGDETRVEQKAFRRGLQSQIEGPVSRDHAYREERFKKMENRFELGSMRSFERPRYSFHSQGRGRQGGRWDGSSDNRRSFRHYSPVIHGHSKFDVDASVERDDHGCVGTQDDASYSQQLPKNRASADGEPCAGFHSRYNTDRKFSPDRAAFGRGRSFRHGPFSESRGGRGRFGGPSLDESFQSSLKYCRTLSRRERSISPFGGRGQSNIHHSRRKSPSRSRSRSPVIWNSPRRRVEAGNGGNTFFKHRSRSPNFRPEARMQRLRSPQQQPGSGPDHAGGFRSISRSHGSPLCNRWNSARKDEPGHFRELGYKQRNSAPDRSPGRIRLRDDRGNAIDSPRNLKPDGYYRISDRFPDDASRGVRYEENFGERRKQYNLLRPARCNFDDGMANKMHQDINDSFSMTNGFRDRDVSSFQVRGLRGIDSRIGDGPRRFRGENHSVIYERDGRFNPNSKQFGVDVMDSSHNSKSEEQYRPNYAGRFSDTNGSNRGC
ncbi:uncharacterized protein LOC110692753 isoform X1 [Chenopodium quinoa]|uniref:uncharacterized protein LOC110692753 isoform X1 n=1 Tax=Chenopodium quinoa TaxID=63459 RepID=UPI000B77152D|nr:uncharacterized protein LOC110692753 isoform X1 [Chenopodium quinoa]XP_021725509.1 uncharacterized protein LOC110692753 isoform X1 [Chenopodium quinoa]XP_021725510.1 uncharacterized protein LOC110692753 isoform X1 [Chenopodium quinoa]XP_021725511.1 uncharacterized protein LOC110692753 isoform X1 [Chenopodium quinoa]